MMMTIISQILFMWLFYIRMGHRNASRSFNDGDVDNELWFACSGGNAPSYVYRLVSELYSPDDRELSLV